MSADWNTPSLSDTYTNFLNFISQRLNDAAVMFNQNFTTPTNLPNGTIRWNGTNLQLEIWNGSSWSALVLAVTGGGTGSTTAAGIRTAAGLGTIATQNSNAVSITGGTIVVGVLSGTIAQANLGTGSDGSGNHFLADNQTYKSISVIRTLLAKSANYTITTTDVTNKTLFVCSGGAFTLTLPPVASLAGYDIVIKNAQTTNSITIAPNAGENIDGSASNLTLPGGASGNFFSFTLAAYPAGNTWYIV